MTERAVRAILAGGGARRQDELGGGVRVLSLKPGHDGTIAFVSDGELVFSVEAEKDSYPRYGNVTGQLVAEALELAPEMPDVLAVGGWHKVLPGYDTHIGAGYFGLDKMVTRPGRVFGKPITMFSSSHERSHLFMAAAMHPGAPIDECAILVWEGRIGAFYHWREGGRAIVRHHVMSDPGNRYSALFALAEPTFPDRGRNPDHDYAGKMMALTAFDGGTAISQQDQDVVERLLGQRTTFPFDKGSYAGWGLYNCGVVSSRFATAARYITSRLFDVFHRAAEQMLPRGLPLLVSGGCGLNCEWNQRWRASSFFSEVFVPPCTNDSGSAVGTAVDAAVQLGDPCRLEWSVYAGSPFVRDVEPQPTRWRRCNVDFDALADRLVAGAVVAWAQGRCEIGPRALGNRSLLASPSEASTRSVLNQIKQRESYRPIAPCCQSEELSRWFDPAIDDPYMLYFSRLTTDRLPAITHVDGTARVQSVRRDMNPPLHRLLDRFKARTGFAVLCNTSLNFKGFGFINTMSDLVRYCEDKHLDDFVVDSDWYRRCDPIADSEGAGHD